MNKDVTDSLFWLVGLFGIIDVLWEALAVILEVDVLADKFVLVILQILEEIDLLVNLIDKDFLFVAHCGE